MVKIGAVINSASGKEAKDRLSEIKEALAPRALPGCIAITAGGEIEHEMLRLKGMVEVLVVGGGDGTVSSAARILGGSRVALLVLGLGTKNHFARDLGLPLAPMEALQLLDRGRVTEVDLGEVNGRPFINNATVGLYPRVVAERDRIMGGGWKKWQAQLAGAVTSLKHVRRLKVTMEAEGRRVRRLTPFILVGNNEYAGGLLASFSRTDLQGGKLWVCSARVTGPWSLVRSAVHLGIGAERGDDFEVTLAEEVTFHFKRPKITVAIDGENCLLDTPLHFRIRKKCLRVVIP